MHLKYRWCFGLQVPWVKCLLELALIDQSITINLLILLEEASEGALFYSSSTILVKIIVGKEKALLREWYKHQCSNFPMCGSSTFLVFFGLTNSASHFLLHWSNLSFGRHSNRRRVSTHYPTTIINFFGVLSYNNFGIRRVCFLGTGSCSGVVSLTYVLLVGQRQHFSWQYPNMLDIFWLYPLRSNHHTLMVL